MENAPVSSTPEAAVTEDLEAFNDLYTKPIIKYGRLTNLIAVALCFIPAIVIWVYFGYIPAVKDILTGWGLIASIYLVFAFIEPISYYPVVGLSGVYMVCLSGNIANVRIPCAAMAQKVLGTVPGTKKAELVSTLGIAGSIITNLALTTLAAIAGAAIMSVLPPVIIEALGYVSPAIFGAMFGMQAVKNIKYAGFAALLGFLALYVFHLAAYVAVPVLVFGTVAFGMLTQKKETPKKAEA
ncbi:MAG: hypothetical protein ACOX4F_09705 [Atopobiaceae bacterium]|jgi:hypothetical protein